MAAALRTTGSVRCHVSLQDPSTKRVLKRAFTYNWRLWCLADVVELLREARVNKVHVQVKPLHVQGPLKGMQLSNSQQHRLLGCVSCCRLMACFTSCQLVAVQVASGSLSGHM
eukprot:GHRR01025473.1.p2 GENE.GHRR01025473.1~~GHRR01025473.1.p2  ORF type:complete len:113 (+),score=16.03 GHRR01025473.1:1442-1780(+)